MSGMYYYDDGGNLIHAKNTVEWATGFRRSQRTVARDKLANGALVSTVFLGIDHSFDGPPPVLWETMVFEGEFDGYQERYTSREIAEQRHAEIVGAILNGKQP